MYKAEDEAAAAAQAEEDARQAQAMAMYGQTGGALPTIPYQYIEDYTAYNQTNQSSILAYIYQEYLTESGKTPPNLYSVKLLVNAYSYVFFIGSREPTDEEIGIKTMLTTSVRGQPVYSTYTDTNKYDLTYLPGVPDTFKRMTTLDKDAKNCWIYFINTVYTSANAFLTTITTKGAADQIAYTAKKATHTGSNTDIANRASDRVKAATLLRTPTPITDLATVGGSLGPVSSSGPPAPIYTTTAHAQSTLPRNSGPMVGAGRVILQGPVREAY
jgi:hypothetical protein